MSSVKNNCLKMVLTIVFLFFFTHTGAQESQLEGPQNTWSVVGSNVTLKCVSQSKHCQLIEWQKHNAPSPMSVFIDRVGILHPFKERYGVENSSGCHLVIKNVQQTDAGRFICKTFISDHSVEKSAYLIILKNQSKCMTNASHDNTEEGDGVHLTCEVAYNGTNRASMVWKDKYSVVEDAPGAVVKNKTISLSYSIVASAPEVPSFTCFTSFVLEGNIEGLAKNIPVTTCRTPAIKVLYSVRNITLAPSFSSYTPGTAINCAAEGHPSPTFKWQEMENDGSWMDIQNQKNSQFTMTNVFSKRYRCVAMNVVREKSYSATSHEFQVNNTGSEDNDSVTDATKTVNTTPIYLNLTVQIGVGVGVGVILLIVLLIICFCVPSCPGHKCCHSDVKSTAKIREDLPLTENPDLYSDINEVQQGAMKAKPSSAPTSEPPKLPQGAPPQAIPLTDIPKAGQTNTYQHEEVTYADLAKETDPRQAVPKYNADPQETLYSAVGTA